MGMSDMGRDIFEHEHIDSVFPSETQMVLDVKSLTGPLLDDVFAIVFPKGKLMWPVYKVSDNHYRRSTVVRSIITAQYSPMRIFTICADQRGAWVFVEHESENNAVAGFVSSLNGVLVQPFGNVPPVELNEWILNPTNFNR